MTGASEEAVGLRLTSRPHLLASTSKYLGVTVPSLLIRNVDAALHARLKERAAAHNRSLEEEARELLRTSVARQAGARENIVDVARRLFGPRHGVELDIPPRGRAPKSTPPDFSNPEYDQ